MRFTKTKLGKKLPANVVKDYKAQKNVQRKHNVTSGYEYIIFATDQDLDGFHIRGLLIGFFQKYLPELRNIGFLQTPVIGVTKGDKLVRWTYNLNDAVNLKAGEKSSYYKGLGSWDSDDLKSVVKTDGLEKMINMVSINNLNIIEDWLGSDAEPRKDYIINNEFSIASA